MSEMVSVNPYTEEINGRFPMVSLDECLTAAGKARKAFDHWQREPLARRTGLMASLAQRLRETRMHCAGLIVREMGKTIRQALGEVDKCAWLCEFYAEHAESLLEDERVSTDADSSYVTFEPLGVILGIMPWNFPFWQVFRFAVPVLAVGNVCLLKHASNVPMCALEIERLFLDSGFPEQVFRTLLADSPTTGRLVDADVLDGVSLTGSVAAGCEVGALAGRRIKKLVLELGGSDPFIVLNDADLAKAAETAVAARTMNAGQSCIAAKRFIVHEAVSEEFVERYLRGLDGLRAGDPMLQETDLGPLAKLEMVRELQAQLDDAAAKGATILAGTEVPAGRGFFFRPALVTGASREMRVVREEVFGPVAPILRFRDEARALELANDTEFGLGAAVWSDDRSRAQKLARGIQAGFVAINDMVKSDPRLPFGGIKKSGIGRELSHYGLKEFANVKTVVVR